MSDLPTRRVNRMSEERQPSGDRSEYFRQYDKNRANDPHRREQWREAKARERARRADGQ